MTKEIFKTEESEGLKKEIEEIKNSEMIKKEEGESSDPHWSEIETKDLISEDLVIYEKYKNKTLTRKEFSAYIEKILKQENSSRRTFSEWLSNKVTVLFWERELKNFQEE